MDIYTLGKFALPGVVAIMAVAAVLTLFAGVFTAVKSLASLKRFFRQLEENKQPSVTINIQTGRRASQPPMQAKK
jgi:cytochrome c-type biogenesis protein CcmH/NrfG